MQRITVARELLDYSSERVAGLDAALPVQHFQMTMKQFRPLVSKITV